ncbi:MAG: hypothetical protein HQ483_10090 [Rhodospirillales bacterium]|nr:hypothetical protein [Rhodospirillales bacterium]
MRMRLVIFRILLVALTTGLLAWIGYEVFRQNYLEAVAISGVSSVLL